MENNLHTSNISDNSPDQDEVKTYTVAGLAKVLGINRQTLYNWIQAGKLPSNVQVIDQGANTLLRYTPPA